MYIQVRNIEWDTEGDTVDLPTKALLQIDVPNHDDLSSEISNRLSNLFGWCTRTFSFATYETLDDLRRVIAEDRYAQYRFGLQVETAGSWEWITPGAKWTRAIFLANDAAPEAPLIKGIFTVVFEDQTSAVVTESYCMLDGNFTGSAAAEQADDAIIPDGVTSAAPMEPCPFCGGTNFTWIRNSEDSLERMQAPMCQCGAQGPMYPTRADAVTAWNKRYRPTELRWNYDMAAAPLKGAEILLLVPRRNGHIIGAGSNSTGIQWWIKHVGAVEPVAWAHLPR